MKSGEGKQGSIAKRWSRRTRTSRQRHRVKGFGGKIYDKQYDLWADDGDGGPSYAVQTPASAYNRDKCASLFKRKLTELGLVDPQPVDPQ
jgi:hypothetical protein